MPALQGVLVDCWVWGLGLWVWAACHQSGGLARFCDFFTRFAKRPAIGVPHYGSHQKFLEAQNPRPYRRVWKHLYDDGICLSRAYDSAVATTDNELPKASGGNSLNPKPYTLNSQP